MVKNLPVIQDGTLVPSLGWEEPPGEGNGNPLQYSCLENSMDRGTWWATVHGVTKSQTQLSDYIYVNPHLPIHPTPPLYTSLILAARVLVFEIISK